MAYFRCGENGDESTPLTPSNSSPATITSGTKYEATANGKAVASVTDVTPSSTPTSVSTNDVVKIGGNGVIVDSIPTPTSITPSLTSEPISMSAQNTYKPTINCYAIETYNQTAPSNSQPVSLFSKTIHRISSNGGWAIDHYNNVTPSSTPISKTTNDIVRFNGSGVIVDGITNLTPQTLAQGGTSMSTGTFYNPSSACYAVSNLPSGSQTFDANGTYDVTNLAQAIVSVHSGGSIIDLSELSYVGGVRAAATATYAFLKSYEYIIVFAEAEGTNGFTSYSSNLTLIEAIPRADTGTNRSFGFFTASNLVAPDSISLTSNSWVYIYIFGKE